MPGQPTVRPLSDFAPFESCVACFKGDTRTGLAVRGPAEWCMAGLMRLGLDPASAKGIVLDYAEEVLGCRRGLVPVEPVELMIRVCASCASRAGLKVGDVEDAVPVYEPR